VCVFLVSLLVDLGLFGHFCIYYKEFDILIFSIVKDSLFIVNVTCDMP
jgi:hypothetical protein